MYSDKVSLPVTFNQSPAASSLGFACTALILFCVAAAVCVANAVGVVIAVAHLHVGRQWKQQVDGHAAGAARQAVLAHPPDASTPI